MHTSLHESQVNCNTPKLQAQSQSLSQKNSRFSSTQPKFTRYRLIVLVIHWARTIQDLRVYFFLLEDMGPNLELWFEP